MGCNNCGCQGGCSRCCPKAPKKKPCPPVQVIAGSLSGSRAAQAIPPTPNPVTLNIFASADAPSSLGLFDVLFGLHAVFETPTSGRIEDALTTFTLPDGSTLTAFVTGTFFIQSGIVNLQFSGPIVQGSGQFKNCKGTLSVTGTTLPGAVMAIAPINGTFTIELDCCP